MGAKYQTNAKVVTFNMVDYYDIHDFVAATFSANMPTQQMIDVIEYGRLFLLFDVKVHKHHEMDRVSATYS
jgi:hypothetical protein